MASTETINSHNQLFPCLTSDCFSPIKFLLEWLNIQVALLNVQMLEQYELYHLICFCWIKQKVLKSSPYTLYCMQLSPTKVTQASTQYYHRVHIIVLTQYYYSRRMFLTFLLFCSISTSRKGKGCGASPT